jgi:hypothetical protein
VLRETGICRRYDGYTMTVVLERFVFIGYLCFWIGLSISNCVVSMDLFDKFRVFIYSVYSFNLADPPHRGII